MTLRRQQVYELLLEAKTYNEISEQLNISPSTVKSHATNIYCEYNVKTRCELMAVIIKQYLKED